jgi:hypothetical protein
MIDATLQIYSKLTRYMDAICDDKGVEVAINAAPIWNGMNLLKGKGVHLRWITNITSQNVQWCKEFMKIVEVRHIDGIKGAFGIHDNQYYMASANVLRKGKIFPSELIVSNVSVVVQQQQQIFDLLWDKALPAKQRIKEIELGLQRQFINTIRDPIEITEAIFDILASSTSNIEILISNDLLFNHLKKIGIIENLVRMQTERNMDVRILVIFDSKDGKNCLDANGSNSINNLDSLRYLSKGIFGSNITTFIVDSTFSLAIEMKDSNNNLDFDESLGIATYSNSQPTVNTYEIIFENLWNKSEFEITKK